MPDIPGNTPPFEPNETNEVEEESAVDEYLRLLHFRELAEKNLAKAQIKLAEFMESSSPDNLTSAILEENRNNEYELLSIYRTLVHFQQNIIEWYSEHRPAGKDMAAHLLRLQYYSAGVEFYELTVRELAEEDNYNEWRSHLDIAFGKMIALAQTVKKIAPYEEKMNNELQQKVVMMPLPDGWEEEEKNKNAAEKDESTTLIDLEIEDMSRQVDMIIDSRQCLDRLEFEARRYDKAREKHKALKLKRARSESYDYQEELIKSIKELISISKIQIELYRKIAEHYIEINPFEFYTIGQILILRENLLDLEAHELELALLNGEDRLKEMIKVGEKKRALSKLQEDFEKAEEAFDEE